MSFAAWTKRSKLFKQNNRNYDVKELCQAAYKAGERDGRRQVEEIAKQAIELRNMLNSGKNEPQTVTWVMCACGWMKIIGGACSNPKCAQHTKA